MARYKNSPNTRSVSPSTRGAFIEGNRIIPIGVVTTTNDSVNRIDLRACHSQARLEITSFGFGCYVCFQGSANSEAIANITAAQANGDISGLLYKLTVSDITLFQPEMTLEVRQSGGSLRSSSILRVYDGGGKPWYDDLGSTLDPAANAIPGKIIVSSSAALSGVVNGDKLWYADPVAKVHGRYIAANETYAIVKPPWATHLALIRASISSDHPTVQVHETG